MFIPFIHVIFSAMLALSRRRAVLPRGALNDGKNGTRVFRRCPRFGHPVDVLSRIHKLTERKPPLLEQAGRPLFELQDVSIQTYLRGGL
jgi:hypothetical protein